MPLYSQVLQLPGARSLNPPFPNPTQWPLPSFLYLTLCEMALELSAWMPRCNQWSFEKAQMEWCA